MSQEHLGDTLTSITGRTWSRATVSAAESGWDGVTGRVRHFDVDELVAMSLALDFPPAWFLQPPSVTPDRRNISDDIAWITPSKSIKGPWHKLTSSELRRLITASLESRRSDVSSRIDKSMLLPKLPRLPEKQPASAMKRKYLIVLLEDALATLKNGEEEQ